MVAGWVLVNPWVSQARVGVHPAKTAKPLLQRRRLTRSVTVQGKYANSKLDDTHLVAGVQKDSTIQAYYVQASWFVTGERSIYSGAFGKPKPIRKWGALEVAARYDLAENTNQSLSADPCGTGTSKCQVQGITLGVNWYVRQSLRFMLNYYLTEAAIGNAGAGPPERRDNPSVISFRTQLSF